jgi:hypothetical protein
VASLKGPVAQASGLRQRPAAVRLNSGVRRARSRHLSSDLRSSRGCSPKPVQLPAGARGLARGQRAALRTHRAPHIPGRGRPNLADFPAELAAALLHVAAEFCDFGRIRPRHACIAVSRRAASGIQSRSLCCPVASPGILAPNSSSKPTPLRGFVERSGPVIVPPSANLLCGAA